RKIRIGNRFRWTAITLPQIRTRRKSCPPILPVAIPRTTDFPPEHRQPEADQSRFGRSSGGSGQGGQLRLNGGGKPPAAGFWSPDPLSAAPLTEPVVPASCNRSRST